MFTQRPLFRAAIILLAVAVCLVFFLPLCDRALRAARRAAVTDYALSAAAEFSVPAALVLAVIEAESDFRPHARSDAGAVGLMQLMPDTFCYLRDERLLETLPDGAIDDPRTNVRYGTCYLAYLRDRFGTLREVLAAYNAGEGRVSAWLTDARYGNGTELTAIPYPETEHYVARVLAAYRRYSEKYKT